MNFNVNAGAPPGGPPPPPGQEQPAKIGGDTSAQPTDPAAGANGGSPPPTPFKAPSAWSAWSQPQPPPVPQQPMPPQSSYPAAQHAINGSIGMPGNRPGLPPVASAPPGMPNAPSPLQQSLLSGPGGLPGGAPKYDPKTQAAIDQNTKFTQSYVKNQQKAHSQLAQTLQQLTGMLGNTNPYSGMTQNATLTGQ